jgi:hypothetical protein
MSWPAGELLAGPRGRRLCWSLLEAGDDPGWERLWRGAMAGDLSGLVGELAALVARTDVDAIAVRADELALLPGLGESVVWAMYWQEPGAVDQALAESAVWEALMPVAAAVTIAPASQWWSAPVAADRQQYVEWLGEADTSPAFAGADAELASWRAATMADERSARERPEDPSAPWGGPWWSAPLPSRLPRTTRAIPGIGAVGLPLVEDSLGWQEARCWPMQVAPGARIYEISGPAEWADLVRRYPLDVSKSRRHDWWRATGRAGRWLIPDFTAVASDYDAVHLSVRGYLTTAGRALSVGGAGAAVTVREAGEAPDVDDARTVLAGWDPDQTYWLADVLAPSGAPTRWVESQDEPLGWVPAE